MIGLLYDIWRRRAKRHPTIPSESGKYVQFHWYLGHCAWFLKNAEAENYSELYHQQVEIPQQKLNPNNFKLMCGSAPNLPFSPLPKYNLMLYDPKLVKILFHDKFDDVQKTDRISGPFNELWGNGIFSSDPPKWKWHRKVASRIFSMRNVKDNIFGCGLKNAKILIDKLYEYRDNKMEIDIHDLLGRFTLQSFVESSFGEHLPIIESTPNKHPFNDAFDETLHLFLSRYADLFWKFKKYLKIGQREGVDIPKYMKIINDFVYNVIASRQNKQLFHDEAGVDGDKYDLLSLFLKHRIGDDDQFSDKEIRDITINFITAARDTTKVLLSWFLYEIYLEKNKHILQKLLKEIDDNSDYKNYTDINDIKYDETFKTKYKYLTATLLETLRYHPSVPFLQRYAVKDFELEFEGKKHFIESGTGCCVALYGYGRMKHIFGDDVYQFNPMRFYEKGINTFNEFEFPNFNTNPRLCLGRNVALMQAKIVAILLFLLNIKKSYNYFLLFFQ